MTNKKSQQALEFFMTYGWAILVVLIAIGALAYFGVLSPDRFLPKEYKTECQYEFHYFFEDYNCKQLREIIELDIPAFQYQKNKLCYNVTIKTNSKILISNESLFIDYNHLDEKEKYLEKCIKK